MPQYQACNDEVFFTPVVEGALLLAAFVASCFLGALKPVDLRAVCFVRAMVWTPPYLPSFSFGWSLANEAMLALERGSPGITLSPAPQDSDGGKKGPRQVLLEAAGTTLQHC